jgi:hypothetical protein
MKSDSDANNEISEAGDNTEISIKDMYKLMQSIKQDTESTRKQLETIEQRVNVLEEKNDQTDSSILNIKCDVDSIKDTVSLLSGRLIRSETVNLRLQRELSDLKAHSMNNNIIFNFDQKGDFGKEDPQQNSVDIVRTFLSDILKVPNSEYMSISVAHRLGKANVNRPRPIIATFSTRSDIDAIFSKVGCLKGTRHFVSRQLPPDKNERKQFASTEFNEKRKQKNVKTIMVGDKLYINGSLDRKFLRPTIPNALTSIPDDSTLSESDPIEDNGSVFRGFSSSVSSLDDVSQTLDMLMRRHEVASASHVIFAYRILDGVSGDITENFESDGDHGVGLRLLKEMQQEDIVNKLFVATRICNPGYTHIGQRRFDHVKEVCFGSVK